MENILSYLSRINPALVVGVVFAFALPLGLMGWWRRKTRSPHWEFLAGMLCFVVFALVLEQLLHSYCIAGDNAVSRAVMGSPILYTLYTAFAAGIFEETGRLFGFTVLLRRRKEDACAVAYGLGHGGIEAILILGVNYLAMLLAQLGVPMGSAAATASLKATAAAIPLFTSCIACVERLSAICIHIGLSMLVFVAARRRGRLWLYPAAIVLHALVDGGAALYQYGVFHSIFAVEIWAAALGVVCVVLGALALYRQKKEPVPAETAPAVAPPAPAAVSVEAAPAESPVEPHE